MSADATRDDAAQRDAAALASFVGDATGERAEGLTHFFRAERATAVVPELSPYRAAVPPIARVGVVGGGTMGRDIAYVNLAAGKEVVLLEANRARLDAAVDAIRGHFARRVERGGMDAHAMDAALARLTPTLDYAPFATADLVVEAVVEQLPVKLDVFRALNDVVRPDALLASNTSTLPIAALAAAVRNPGRVIGLHFFSPARVMRLLEVVRARSTAPETAAAALAYAAQLEKVPVLVGDCYGFVSNRLTMVYGAEANALLEEGATPEQVDRPLVEFGMPMGPLTMSDMAGNDIGYYAHPGLRAAYGPRARSSPIVARLHEAGRHGQKTGGGYFDYPAGAKRGAPSPTVAALLDDVRRELGVAPREIAPDEILRRVLYLVVNEGALCLDEGIARTPDDVDVVMVLGFGFPAWRGGLMHWAAREGYGRIVAALEEWAAKGGARYAPARWMRERA